MQDTIYELFCLSRHNVWKQMNLRRWSNCGKLCLLLSLRFLSSEWNYYTLLFLCYLKYVWIDQALRHVKISKRVMQTMAYRRSSESKYLLLNFPCKDITIALISRKNVFFCIPITRTSLRISVWLYYSPTKMTLNFQIRSRNHVQCWRKTNRISLKMFSPTSRMTSRAVTRSDVYSHDIQREYVRPHNL